jgi:hypothetical protein
VEHSTSSAPLFDRGKALVVQSVAKVGESDETDLFLPACVHVASFACLSESFMSAIDWQMLTAANHPIEASGWVAMPERRVQSVGGMDSR